MVERILCVEGDPDIGKLLVAILGEAGYPADWVTNGEEALACWPFRPVPVAERIRGRAVILVRMLQFYEARP
ncbi:MAG: hypothetical protein L0H73_02395 [Nitrococcus sp.]|nr:hypothetical protein [Nitrococcus sp.]